MQATTAPRVSLSPYLDLSGGHGVVLVDDRQGAQLQQAEDGVLEVLLRSLWSMSSPSEEDLGHSVVVLGEQPVVGVHQLALSHGGGRLLAGHVSGPAGQIQLAHPPCRWRRRTPG